MPCMEKIRAKRFSRSAYLRRFERIYAEMKDWRDFYRAEAKVAPIGYVGKRFMERAESVDDVMHSCDEAMRSLMFVS